MFGSGNPRTRIPFIKFTHNLCFDSIDLMSPLLTAWMVSRFSNLGPVSDFRSIQMLLALVTWARPCHFLSSNNLGQITYRILIHVLGTDETVFMMVNKCAVETVGWKGIGLEDRAKNNSIIPALWANWFSGLRKWIGSVFFFLVDLPAFWAIWVVPFVNPQAFGPCCPARPWSGCCWFRLLQ